MSNGASVVVGVGSVLLSLVLYDRRTYHRPIGQYHLSPEDSFDTASLVSVFTYYSVLCRESSIVTLVVDVLVFAWHHWSGSLNGATTHPRDSKSRASWFLRTYGWKVSRILA